MIDCDSECGDIEDCSGVHIHCSCDEANKIPSFAAGFVK